MSCAPYVPSPLNIVWKMLKLADVGPEDVVYDLGCGDGRILFSAIKEFRAKKAVGYELRRDLYKAAVKNVERQNLQKRITIFNYNLFEADISEADVITLYLTTSGNERLKPKLVKEAQLGTRVVSRSFTFNDWQPLKIELFGYTDVNLYIIPDAFNSSTKRRLVKKHSFLDRLFENPFL